MNKLLAARAIVFGSAIAPLTASAHNTPATAYCLNNRIMAERAPLP